MEYIKLIGGLLLLVVAGDVLIRGAVSLAQSWGVSKLVIGLTVVAFGTSAPELVVGIDAALMGVPTLALGNVVGSNIANVLLVIGVPALFFPFFCNDTEVRKNLLIMLGGTVLFMLLCLTGPLGFWQGQLMMGLLIGFLVYSFKHAGSSSEVAKHAYEDIDELPDEPLPCSKSVIFLVLGLGGLMFGAHILVDGAVVIARGFGVSEAVIGLTIIAIGTSLPELVTAIMAARHGHGDVAVGNVIGSNLFNLYAIMGATALTAPVPIPQSFLEFDLWVMLGASLLLLPFVIWKIQVSKLIGGVFAGTYLAYLYMVGNF